MAWLRWLSVALASVVAQTSSTNLVAYVSLTWQNELLSVIEANEAMLVTQLRGFALPFTMGSLNVSNVNVALQTIDVLAGPEAALNDTQSYEVALAVTATGHGNVTSDALVAFLTSIGDVGSYLTSHMVNISSSIVTNQVSTWPTAPWLALNPPATVSSIFGDTPFLLVTLRYLAPNGLQGVHFSSATLCRMRVAMQDLLNSSSARFVPLAMSNTTQFSLMETLVVHGIPLNTTSLPPATITNLLLQGEPLPSGGFLRLADLMDVRGFPDASRLGLMVSVDAINATPMQVVTAIDGGVVDTSVLTDFIVSDTALAPVLSSPASPCPAPWCLHVVWNHSAGNSSFFLSRIKTTSLLSGTVFASGFGARMPPGNASVWTFFGAAVASPLSHIQLDLVRASDKASISVDVSAAMLSANEATSTITSTSSSRAPLYTDYRAYIRNGNEVSLLVHLHEGAPNNATYATTEAEACALCTPLVARCSADANCSSLLSCAQESLPNPSAVLANATIGSVLDVTPNITACMLTPAAATPSRTLFTSAMQCLLARTCPFYSNGTTQLAWHSHSVGWTQLRMNRLSDTVPLNISVTRPYKSDVDPSAILAPCVVSLTASQLPSAIARTIQNCNLNDSQVTVLYNLDLAVNATLPVSFDIFFSTSLSPLPGITLPPTLPNLTLATVQNMKYPSIGLLALPMANYSHAPNLLPPTATCLPDPTCNAITNCIMQAAFPSISRLFATGDVGDGLDLSGYIRNCSSPDAFTSSVAARALHNVSVCYASTQCSVAPATRAANNRSSVVWQVPPRIQTLWYNQSLPRNATTVSVTAIATPTNTTLVANLTSTGLQAALQKLLDLDVVVSAEAVVAPNVSAWSITYPAFAGYCPTLDVVDATTNVPLQVVDDPFPSSFLAVTSLSSPQLS
ncbi:hypothetical protein SPRG_14577 [Saprolegnia parasitica CBS 223.65]|uniref:Secreted protein n=1 Tax=Saprolegnia parasitica (strain CBS 223.65) TaxID=695850 RepID=A0A067BZI0_SAPPC|nr:hypothetical protein SPRG_14577 [Saprolegnia parasitica CBS 223.65]KDO19997.1 hypothetical protein SPRG_14577 [Saprolegnia parasitica CBS 223.65]|eukprot:XP_012209300.1 hypothetical protein SPRG_14577 [Saprolegnia parasitica CBS 223.65]